VPEVHCGLDIPFAVLKEKNLCSRAIVMRRQSSEVINPGAVNATDYSKGNKF